MNKEYVDETALKVFIELRQEMMEAQRARTQIIGFKITFIGTGIGIILANMNNIPTQLLIIPAFGAFFFDLLIISYNITISELAFYDQTYVQSRLHEWLSPQIWETWRESYTMPWRPINNLAIIGNIGMTCLAAIPAMIALFSPYSTRISLPLLLLLLFFIVYDIYIHIRTNAYLRR